MKMKVFIGLAVLLSIIPLMTFQSCGSSDYLDESELESYEEEMEGKISSTKNICDSTIFYGILSTTDHCQVERRFGQETSGVQGKQITTKTADKCTVNTCKSFCKTERKEAKKNGHLVCCAILVNATWKIIYDKDFSNGELEWESNDTCDLYESYEE